MVDLRFIAVLFFVEIHTPHGLVFQGVRGGWLLGSLGVNVGLSGLPGMR